MNNSHGLDALIAQVRTELAQIDALRGSIADKLTHIAELHEAGRERTYSIKGASEWLGVSEKTVARIIANNELSHYKVGRRTVISETHLTRYLESRQVQAS